MSKNMAQIVINNAKYEKKAIKGDGACVYRSLSFALYGDENKYDRIIDDCIRVFKHIPMIYYNGVEFAAQICEKGSIDNYEVFMNDCIAKTNSGVTIHDKMFWGEDGHFEAISLLYDICIYVYSDTVKRWNVYNKDGSTGYICLLNAYDHTSVLHGTEGNVVPEVPKSMDFIGYSRTGIDWWSIAENLIGNCTEPFPFVWHIPTEITQAKQTTIEMLTLTEDNKYLCVLCNNKKFKTNGSLDKHMKTFHKKNYINAKKPCIIDKSSLPTQLKACDMCKDKFFCSLDDLKNHMLKVHVEARTFICIYCNKSSFSSELKLKEHELRNHRSWSKLANNPDICSEVYVTGSMNDSDESPVLAQVLINKEVTCNVMKSSNQRLVQAKQTEKIKYSCNFCSRKFITSHSLQTHQQKFHHNIKQIKAENMHLQEQSLDLLTSQVKNKSLQQMGHGRHARKSVQERLVQSKQNDEIFMKHFCGQYNSRKIYSPNSLQAHMQKHHCTNVKKIQLPNVDSQACSASQVSDKPESIKRSQRVQNKLKSTLQTVAGIQKKHNDRKVAKNEINEQTLTFKRSKSFLQHFSNARQKEKNKAWKRHKASLEPENESWLKLEKYVQYLGDIACDVSTQLLSPEVRTLLLEPSKMNESLRKIECSKDDLERLTELTNSCKTLLDPQSWTWNAKMDVNSEQGKSNDRRMQFWEKYDMDLNLLKRCKNCGCSDLLYGQHEKYSQFCHDCMAMKDRERKRKTKNSENKSKNDKNEIWLKKVKPKSPEFPKRTEEGHKNEYLPDINAAERAAIALVHPVTTIKKYFLWYKRFRCESITLSQQCDETWAKLLPRTDLKGRFIIIERTIKNTEKKYICVDSEKVRQWLLLFFDEQKGHEGVLQRKANGLLEMSEEAINKLKTVSEMAEVDIENYEESEQANDHTERSLDVDEDGTAHSSMHPTMSENHVFAFESKDHLYMNKKEVLKLKDKGLMQFVTDSSKRSQSFNVSAKDAFPHLYTGKNRIAPNECKDTTIAARMLRKLMLYPLEYYESGDIDHPIENNNMRWFYAEDDVHMAHQYSAIDERRINDKVGFYISQQPQLSSDVSQLLEILKHGADDHGIIDSHLPGLTQALSSLQGSREHMFAERMGIEAISKDLGDPNWFLTLSFEPRYDPHIRKLISMLENPKLDESSKEHDNWQFKNTEHFTKMMDKHAIFVSMLISHKFETFMDALCDICNIPKKQKLDDWTKRPPKSVENGWYFSRCEFTETRGVAHYHTLIHLPNVIPTSLLGRVIQNGRLVRDELKYGNIKQECVEEAWHLIEMGLLAQQYAIKFVESVSMSSFYTEQMLENVHNAEKVIDLDALRAEFRKNHKKGNINKKTNALMRKPGDEECNKNRNMEIAEIAAISQIHDCLADRCGGYNDASKENTNLNDPNRSSTSKTQNRTCRFDYPKPLKKQSVATIININSEQNEAQVLLRRTHPRVNNIHPLIAFYFRSNHDSTGLIDAAHSKRYCTKYVSKNSKHSEMYVQLLEELSKRGLQNLRNNVRHVLVQVFLASCSHRTFMSKLEIAHRVMQLPIVMKSYSNVEVVSCYWRATLLQSSYDKNVWVYSDRTKLAAYAERLDSETVYKNCTPQEKEKIKQSNFKEFAETVRCVYQRNDKNKNTTLYKKHQLKSCEKGTGHWIISKRRGRGHIRCSTILNTDLASNYTVTDLDTEATYPNFLSMPLEKRRQLVRSFYELVMYEPWHTHPDVSFLSEDVIKYLYENDLEAEYRYSLLRNERYYEEYEKRWKKGQIAKPGTAWHKDNQQAYTLYLVHDHNSDLRLSRRENNGKFNALMEPAENVIGADIDVRPLCPNDDDNDTSYPSVENFLPHDIYKGIMEQTPLQIDKISVAYPSQPQYRCIENSIRTFKSKRFFADPPNPRTQLCDLNELQQKFVEIAVSGNYQVLYLTGVAGSGKTEVILHIMKQLKGRVQACASTGIAARNLNAPTLHGMLGLSMTDCSNSEMRIDTSSNKCRDNAIMYENTEVFIIDEVNMLPAHVLGFVEELMTKSFNPKLKKHSDYLLPFGGKRVILVGDPAQLPPVDGKPFYIASNVTPSTRRYNDLKLEREQKGLQIYLDYMRPNVTVLQRSHRNMGLLAEIANSLRKGTQSRNELDKLQLQYKRHPNALPDRGIHYTNESAAMYNFTDLYRYSQLHDKRIFVCKASYFETENNRTICDSLAAIPAKHYNFAPDLLCVYEGCEIRLVKNLDVAAGLVNGANGTIIRVVYDAADAKFVSEGQTVPPAYLIVDFSEFRGFKGDNTNFTFTHHPTWVALIREKFSIMQSNLPKHIRCKQKTSDCWRMQFPVDISIHVTSHRSQGSTMNNTSILIDLELQSPSKKVPQDAGAILYVAITRSNALKHLLVTPIFPEIWDGLCKSSIDDARRAEESTLKELGLQFAEQNNYREIVEKEFDFVPLNDNTHEWSDLVNDNSNTAFHSKHVLELPQYNDFDFEVDTENSRFKFVQKIAQSIRHIGIDQGVKNFAIVVVDQINSEDAKIVSAKLYDLKLPKKFNAPDVILALSNNTDLFSWMQLPNEKKPPTIVDRIFVHVEQMSLHNPKAKVFGEELANALQSRSPDLNTVIVKHSQPNLHYASGVSFKLGRRIIQELNLKPVTYSKTKYSKNPAATKKRSLDDSLADNKGDEATSSYNNRKRMSAAIFKYIMLADDDQLKDMKLQVDGLVKECYAPQLNENTSVKLDDLGDALLHALKDIVCGSSSYKQVLPKTISLYDNRTVGIMIYPDKIYWVVIACSWNSYICEAIGAFEWRSITDNDKYLDDKFIDRIIASICNTNIQCSVELELALTSKTGENIFTPTNHIKVIVKQLTAFDECGIENNKKAGALTTATVKAMRKMCDNVMGTESHLMFRQDKQSGVVYMRSDRDNNFRIQVIQSTGKHLNGILCFLGWFRENLPKYVEERRLMLREDEKCKFFEALRDLALNDENRLELFQISDKVKAFLASNNEYTQHRKYTRNFADLILMALSKNQQQVKAVAAHYRQTIQYQNIEPPKKKLKRCIQLQKRFVTQVNDTNEPPSKRSAT